jgi:hypothetical protein
MNLKEQNWKNFCTHNLRNLSGLWVGYTPKKEVFGSFQMTRSFQSNKEQTEITHKLGYPSTEGDGTVKEQAWQLSKHSSNLPDGIVHPESPLMRTLCFEQGATASVVKQLEMGSPFRIQFSFKHEDLVSSVVVFYDDSGSLMRTVCMRLDAANVSSQYWSTELNLLPERNLSDGWQGTAVTMTPDLNVSTAVPTQLRWGWKENENFFFPDGISLSCPTQASIGTDLVIAANWLMTSSQLQQMLVQYDEFGVFSMLTLELLHLEAKAP